MNAAADFLPIKELVADRLKWRAVVPMSIELLPEEHARNWLANQVTAIVEVHLLTREVRTETLYTLAVPATWFQHFKSAVLPEWLKGWFPPRFNEVPVTVRHHHNCPHIDAPRNGRLHFLWLGENNECSTTSLHSSKTQPSRPA